MRPDFAPLAVLAMALPFVFGITEAPYSNFWPLLASGACAWLLAALAWCGAWRPSAARLGAHLAAGLLLAALVAAAIGLVQFFMGDPGWAPWVHASSPGLAFGNLRQRNQQATLLALGVWALLWWVARLQEQVDGNPVLGGRGARWPVLAAVAVPWAMVLLATAGAATASRTGALEWLVVLALLAVWRRSSGALALGMAGVGLAVYAVAAWGLPQLLLRWTGMRMDGLFMRMADGSQTCVGRATLWSNVLELIAQRPWAGWGWGELDYAHYIHPFAGERFCVLLDNAHNLPLHLAVELGLPVAAVACGAVVAWVVRARPWQETDAVRQLAWGALAIIGLHSMVEFPLWYGPFQLVTVLALALLCRRALLGWVRSPALLSGAAVVWVIAGVLGAGIAWDYYRVSQLYRPMAFRAPSYQGETLAKVSGTPLFTDHVDFALLTTTALTRENASQVHTLATELLHFSPEPRVIEKLIESALLLGRDDEVAFQLRRYRVAYPEDHARWARAQRLASSTPQ